VLGKAVARAAVCNDLRACLSALPPQPRSPPPWKTGEPKLRHASIVARHAGFASAHHPIIG
jgi:hypothetical protein